MPISIAHASPVRLVSTALSVMLIFAWSGLFAATFDYKRTLLVSPSASNDPTENGALLLDVIGSLSTLVPPPSESSPYLVKIEPGVYDVGNTPVQMVDFVDIEGSGRAITKLEGAVEDFWSVGAVVNGANHCELRDLTVQHVGGGAPFATAIFIPGDMRLTRVIATVQSDDIQARGISIGRDLWIWAGKVVLQDVSVIMNTSVQPSGQSAIYACCHDQILLNNVHADGGDGTGLAVVNFGVVLRNSTVEGANYSVVAELGDVHLVSTQVIGAMASGLIDPFRCVGCYDEDFQLLGSDCLPLSDEQEPPYGKGKGRSDVNSHIPSMQTTKKPN